MPHLRKRYLEDTVRKMIAFSPIVGILGHRQVGKTTLLEKVCSSYFSLDQIAELRAATEDPAGYLARRKGGAVALDECQWVPELFPALKNCVRLSKKPGQYLLSGSIRFTSKKAIRESLTGRIINLELYPFTVAELEGEPMPRIWGSLLECKDFSGYRIPDPLGSSESNRKLRLAEAYFVHGGLPGICMIRQEALRRQKLEDQFETLLDRDLQQVYASTLPLQRILTLCEVLAKTQGETLRWTELQKEVRVSKPTLHQLIRGLEAVFLIRRLPVEGGRKVSRPT